MESQNDIDPVQLIQQRRMINFAMRSSYKSLKQTNMLVTIKESAHDFVAGLNFTVRNARGPQEVNLLTLSAVSGVFLWASTCDVFNTDFH